jgi:hypothetical protein
LTEKCAKFKPLRGFQYPLKNNIDLPPGSKDLVALKVLCEKVPNFSREWESVSGWIPADAQPEGIDHGPLWRVEKHVTELLSARIKPSFLAIQAGAYPLQLFCETEAGPLQLISAFPENDPERERAILGFFADRGMEPLADNVSGRPGWRIIRYALPCVIRPASSLIAGLLKDAYRISEYFPLHFLFGRHPGGLW